MNVWPQREFLIETSITTEEIKTRLQRVTNEVKEKEISPYRVFNKPKRIFEGEFSNDNFVLVHLYYNGLNSYPNATVASIVMRGEIKPNINGSTIILKLQLDKSSIHSYKVFWFIGFMFIITSFFIPKGNGEELLFIFGCAMFLPTIMAWLVFRRWVNKLKSIFEKVIEHPKFYVGHHF